MKYDDASWHYGGKFPKGSPIEYGATHIALLLKWCFLKGWAGELHTIDFADEYSEFITGKISATKYFMANCDGKFTDEDLNTEGNKFMNYYYGKDDIYLNQYVRNFRDFMYLKPEEDHSWDVFNKMVTTEFEKYSKENA